MTTCSDALGREAEPHVLVVDEVTDLTYGDDAANVLFHVVNERHTCKRAMIFTTSKHPRSWARAPHDDDLADAIVDRILHRGRLLRLDGPSMRTKHLADDAALNDTHDELETAEFPERTQQRFRNLHNRPHRDFERTGTMSALRATSQ